MRAFWRMAGHWLPQVVLVFVIVSSAVQAATMLANYGVPWAKATWRTRNLAAMDRSARFLLGAGGMEYMHFLQLVVPVDMAVVVPPAAAAFSQQNNMQFFLLPRGVPACPCGGAKASGWTQQCEACLRSPNLAVPAIKEFPPPQVMQPQMTFLPFPQQSEVFLGAYVPAGTDINEDVSPVAKTGGLGSLAVALGRAAVVFALLALLGALACRVIFQMSDRGLVASVCVPLGLGLLTWSTFVVAWLQGGRVDVATFLAVYLALIICLLWLRPRVPVETSRSAMGARSQTELSRRVGVIATALIVAVCFCLLLSAAISVGRAYSIYDDIANWGLKGHAIAFFKSIYAGRSWGGHGLSYPQNIHLGIALFGMVDGDALPGSKLIFPVMFASLVAGCALLWRRGGVTPVLSAAGALAITTLPVVFFHSTTGYANLPFTTYLVLGVLLIALGFSEGRTGALRGGSLLLGLAAWTRPEGFGFSVAALGSLWLINRRRLHGVGGFASLVLPLLVVSGVWLAFGTVYQVEDEIGWTVTGFVAGLRQGDLDLGAADNLAGYAWRSFITPRLWGTWLLMQFMLLVVALGRVRRLARTVFPSVALAALVCSAVVASMLYAAHPTHGEDFLAYSFDRAVFPAAILWFWVVLGGAARSSEQVRPAFAGSAREGV